MQSKTKSPKNIVPSTAMVCAVCGCSASLVRRYRNGDFKGNGKLLQRIEIAEMILPEKLKSLIEEAKHAINF